jgi:hypothetical protein
MLTLVFDDTTWSGVDPSARVTTRWCDDAGRAFAVGWTVGRQCWIDWTGLGTFRFDDSSTEVHFRASPGLAPPHARDVFDRIVQPLILQAQGLPVLHASAAAGPEGAIVFCGLSGSGKSTLAYAVGACPGFRQIADDAVVLRADDRGPFSVVPIPFRPRLRDTATAHFGTPTPPATSPADRTDPQPLPLRAIVVLAQRSHDDEDHAPVALTRMRHTSAFSALLTHAHCFDDTDRGAVSRMIESYLAMADAVPLFHLNYRPDFSAIDQLARTITQVIARPLTT